MELSQEIARHVVSTGFADLPEAAVAAAKHSLLDAVGVTLAASGLGEVADAYVEIAREGATASGATVIGCGFKTSPAMAAFTNGAMAHALDYEDTFDVALVHPNAAVVPAALAVAETVPGVSGRDLIVAVAIGADLTCRLGLAIEGHESSGVSVRFLCGAMGAAAATGKLLGLTAAQQEQAFALTLFQVSYPSDTMRYAPSHMRAVREAFSAKAGVIAARLAQRGVRAFERPFEGRTGLFGLYTGGGYDEAALMGGLGTRFAGAEVSFKPWPACRGTHAFIEAALWLTETHDLKPDAIARAETVVSPFFQALCEPPAQKRRPQTAIDAKFSMPFTVATALQHRAVNLEAFLPAAMHDEGVLALAERVDHVVEPRWTTEQATRGTLNVHTTDGRVLSRSVLAPLGHPDNPMSAAAMAEKFAACARHARVPLAPAQASALAGVIGRLESMRNVADLLSV